MSKESRDLYSVLTFLFLGLSTSFLFVFWLIFILSKEIPIHDPSYAQWFLEHKADNQLLQDLLRIVLSYLFENLGLLYNMQRWHTLLQESEIMKTSL